MRLAGDEFERLALDQLDTVYRVARRLTKTPADADDLVQETFLRAWRARDSFDLKTFGIRPWLVRICHNAHLTRSTRDGRRPTPVDTEWLAEVSQADRDPRRTLDLESLDDEVSAALNELAEDYRLVLLLWAVEDFSYKEIAAALQIPIGTVMSRLHRARQKLMEKLGNFAREQRLVAGIDQPKPIVT